MSETKFTPGPLRASSDPFTHVVLGLDGAEIATVRKFADAVLFSAAPDLLAALEGVLGYLADLNGCAWIKGAGAGERGMRQRAKALQAIAFAAVNKAKGV